MKAAPSDCRAGGDVGTFALSALSVLTHDPSDVPVYLSRRLECDVRDIPGLPDTANSVDPNRTLQNEPRVRPARGPHPLPTRTKAISTSTTVVINTRYITFQ
uniref:Uncharacterized protein n=1 Tax=Rhodococcoides fascians D188 TaxID=1051973 RepID=G8JYN1_RHOFA|nr:hypothetical protein pFi_016 [Rhodococcus fascians D188]